VRIHANFAHHRDGALRLLGLPPGADTTPEQVKQALRGWSADAFEQAAADAGLVVAAARRFEQWDAHPQATEVAAQPLVDMRRHGDAAAPAWQPLAAGQRPLQGLRVLDLTRILAGPVAGRTLAAYGADVMLVNSPQLPNIEAIADTSRGKLSTHVDLQSAAGRDTLQALVRDADVFLQGYRPGALAALGFGPDELARPTRAGVVSLSAYGEAGPWGGRRGFDSLVQTATGFNLAEAQAFGATAQGAAAAGCWTTAPATCWPSASRPRCCAARMKAVAGACACRWRAPALWLRSLGRCSGFMSVSRPALDGGTEIGASGFGQLAAVRQPGFGRRPAAAVRAMRQRWLTAGLDLLRVAHCG
jgi:hypothetical protein